MKIINKFKIKPLLYSLSLSRSILYTRNRNIRLKRAAIAGTHLRGAWATTSSDS